MCDNYLIIMKWSFSSRPNNNSRNYWQKLTNYCEVPCARYLSFIIARFLRVGDLSQNVFAQEKKTLTGVEKLIAEALSGLPDQYSWNRSKLKMRHRKYRVPIHVGKFSPHKMINTWKWLWRRDLLNIISNSIGHFL